MATALVDLPTTDSGSVRKTDAMRWMKHLGAADAAELIGVVVPKPGDHDGSTVAPSISNVRVTGAAPFITAVATLLQPLLVWESSATRVALNVKQVDDRESGELTDNYALYISAAKRSQQAGMIQALTQRHSENDQQLLAVLESAGGDR